MIRKLVDTIESGSFEMIDSKSKENYLKISRSFCA